MGALKDVEILGTPLEAIYRGEDREKFRDLMMQIGEPVPNSTILNSLSQIDEAIKSVGLPAVVRPAYTLGGAGGGIGKTKEELARIIELGLSRSRIHQVLIEESVLGWKEIEFEVMRDLQTPVSSSVVWKTSTPWGFIPVRAWSSPRSSPSGMTSSR